MLNFSPGFEGFPSPRFIHMSTPAANKQRPTKTPSKALRYSERTPLGSYSLSRILNCPYMTEMSATSRSGFIPVVQAGFGAGIRLSPNPRRLNALIVKFPTSKAEQVDGKHIAREGMMKIPSSIAISSCPQG